MSKITWKRIIILEKEILNFTPKEANKNEINKYTYAINKVINTIYLTKNKEVLENRCNFIKIFHALNKAIGRALPKNQLKNILKKVQLLEEYEKYLEQNKATIEKYNYTEDIQSSKYNLLANLFEYIANQIYKHSAKKSANQRTEEGLSITKNRELANFFLKACSNRVKEKEFINSKKTYPLWNKYAEHMRKKLIKLRCQKWIKNLPPKEQLKLESRIDKAEEGLRLLPIEDKPLICKSSLFKLTSEPTQSVPIPIPALQLTGNNNSSLFTSVSSDLLKNAANEPFPKATTKCAKATK